MMSFQSRFVNCPTEVILFLFASIWYILRIYLTEISYFYLNTPRINIGDSKGTGWSSDRFTHYEIFPSTHWIKGLEVTCAVLDLSDKRRIPAHAGNWSCLIPSVVYLPYSFGLVRDQEHGGLCRVSLCLMYRPLRCYCSCITAWKTQSGRKANSHIPCRSHAAPMPCR
jgi:hypothetical protein